MSRDVQFSIDRHLDQPFVVEAGHRVKLSPKVLEDPIGAPLMFRHALKLALWQRLAASRGRIEQSALDMSACRVAALYLRSLGESERRACEVVTPEWLLAAYTLFATDAPLGRTDLLQEECLFTIGKLATLRGAALSDLELRDRVDCILETLDGVWEVTVPTEHLLTTGGGTRLVLDPRTGSNAYGCTPRPRPEVLAFASSTASSISQEAYEAAEDLRQKLLKAALDQGLDLAFAEQVERSRQRLALACGIEEDRAIDVVLMPSGTDGEFAALHLARRTQGGRMINIIMEPNETGSGVPNAARGLHYSPLTPQGAAVDAGAPIEGLDPEQLAVLIVELRDDDGRARPLEAVDRDVERLVEEAISSGARCLLHLIDCSKSGLEAPSPGLARRLRRRHPTHLEVVVDACQTRLDAQRLRSYLDAGFMVLVTGSKFFMGPPFSGALLLPECLARRASRAAALPAGLGQYFGRPEWPRSCSRLRASLPPRRNLGLLLRWEAALSEMAAFEAVPREQRRQIISGLAEAARDAIEGSDHLRLEASNHQCDGEQPTTIICFQVLQAQPDHGPLDPLAMRMVHQWLALDISASLPAPLSRSTRMIASTPCHVGQPIMLGRHGAALRLCIGARLVSEVAFSPELGDSYEVRLHQQIDRMCVVIQKAELVARHFKRLAALTGGSQLRAAASA